MSVLYPRNRSLRITDRQRKFRHYRVRYTICTIKEHHPVKIIKITICTIKEHHPVKIIKIIKIIKSKIKKRPQHTSYEYPLRECLVDNTPDRADPCACSNTTH